MAIPNQSIAKFNDLYDLLSKKLDVDIKRHTQEAKEKLESGASHEEMHAFEVAFRVKWAIMDKLMEGKASQKVSKATLAAIRSIIGDELDQYL